MSDKKYDVIIIGSGPGGYVGAIRCAQLGMSVAIIEKYPTLGGTCLNVGCIPSKALLDSSERFESTVKTHIDHGIKVSKVELDLKAMMDRVQNKVVKPTCDGVQYLMKKNKIDVFEGVGSFIDTHTVKVSGKETLSLSAKNIIIATGSKPSTLRGVEVDKKRIITSTEALKLTEVPKHLAIIGAGVIGLELGSVYARLGAKVSVIEYADTALANMDKDLSKEMQKVMKLQGLDFHFNSAVKSASSTKTKVTLTIEDLKKKENFELDCDYCLVAVGRTAYTKALNLEAIGVETDKRSKVKVDGNLRTNHSHIFAIGDVVAGAMLAHKAEEEGVYVAELIAGQKPHIDYNLIPGVVYTHPEVASVGKTQAQLKEEGTEVKVGKFPFKALGRARASAEAHGFIKVIADKTTDEILGVHMIGARCSDLIAQAVVAMEYKASAEDVARICHAHPTYSEAFKEACLQATENRALHT